MGVVSDAATAIGYCHAMIFEGSRPSWDEIQRFIHEQGEAPRNLVRHNVYKNRLSDRAISGSAMLWVDQFVATPSRIKLGTGSPPDGTTGPLPSDEDCWAPDPSTDRECDVKTTFLTIYSEYGVTYETDEVNDVLYTEALLMDRDGKAWAHAMISFQKTTTQVGVILWKIQHVGN